MPRFQLASDDATTLMRAYNALRAGTGTHLDTTPADAFVAAWQTNATAFASDEGFVGLTRARVGEAILTAAPFGDLAAFGASARVLLATLLPAHDLIVIRATTSTPEGDALCDAMGLHYDGLLRRLIMSQNDAGPTARDAAFWSLVPEDALTSADAGNAKE